MTTAELSIAAGVGVTNGTSSKAAFDRWFRYPAGLSQDALSRLFDPRRNPSGGAVVDPFCGAGTVGTRSAQHGWAFLGAEAHPEIAELAQLKLSPAPNLDRLVEQASVIAGTPASTDVALEHELVRRCFTTETLSALVAMRDAIGRVEGPMYGYLKWALLATLRDVANVKVGWPYLRPELKRNPPYADAAQRFEARVGWIVADLRGRTTDPVAQVLRGDSGNARTWLPAGAAKGTVALTSPPYLNNFDYADATRLEMFFWGRNASWAEMVADVRADMLIATTQQTKVQTAADALNGLFPLAGTRAAVKELVEKLAHERGKRKAGKAYDRVLPAYMLGITRVLTQLTTQLAPGSWTGWVVGDSAPYGIYIDTPALIQNAAEELGYHSCESEVLRTRGLRWRTNGTRHQVGLNERLLWMRTPSI